MAKNPSDKLAELLQQEAQLKARIQLLKNRESAAERKRDTRRKILIGGAILARVKRGAWHQKQLMDLLEQELVEDRDRVLFDLPVKVPQSPPLPPATPKLSTDVAPASRE